ncbi:SusC/RagA family TonB-linked outer membrane protein [Maribacter polysaccharolyticus]|uniref:SusC/RagA family TonB-linked outer membrane protein n=1 Tax=Maribacter polysaccharolyticus TaxID=3020831 RepID=UPI00237FBA7E|nr:SusC/RagA family TonB-linked outer membrane protein [Maribacter polysaccharolyticus]MDE3742942.1 SusC/RagA family TonB-linked outer membrane protein [Maribacter polysaccharolyticus]
MKIKLLRSFMLVGAFICFGWAQAQEVSGTVSDANGPLPGASVVEKGTTNGTQTDFDGNFTINVGENATLVFSYVGFSTQEIAVNGQTNIDVLLTEDAQALDEVVIVGYGSSTKKEITSAVAVVDEEAFNKGTVNDASQLLQGKVAGLSIYNKGGNPNEDAVIRLRGISTVGANSEPLVVIDGVVGASLNNVDPNDIASVNVLKDGSAAAIYGTRGSSGVILVTTKRGTAGVTSVDYNGSLAVSTIANHVDVMSANEFAAAGGVDLGQRNDWLDLVTMDGTTKINNVAISGGDGNTSYRISGNFRNAQGILRNSGFKQYNTRASVTTFTLNDRLKIDFNMSYTKRKSRYGFNEALRYALLYNPTAPVFGADSPYDFDAATYGGYFETLGLFDSFNPVSIIQQNTNNGEKSEFTYSANFNFKIIDNWDLNAMISQQSSKLLNKEYYRTTSLWRGNASSPIRKGLARLYNEDQEFKLFELYSTYRTSIGRADITFTGGYSWQETTQYDYFLSMGDFPNDDLQYINALEWSQDLENAGFIDINSNASPEDRIIAFFGRASATFDNAIFFNASIRREGSTKFGANNRWATFPAVGIGADLNNYLNLNKIDLLKVRIGYGVTGALPSNNGLSKSLYEPADGRLSSNQLTDANPDLKWEEKAETNYGIEFAAGRLGATLDIYTRNVSDFILERDVDVTIYPTGRRWENAGELKSQGFELAVNYDILKSEELNYNSGIVLSRNKTTLEKYTIPQEMRGSLGAPGQNDTDMIRIKEGEEIGQIWGPVFTGEVVDGNQVLEDVNNDGQLLTAQNNALDPDGDFKVLGKGTPDFEIGWTNQLSYKNWDLNAFFRGAFGHSLINTYRAFYEPRVGSQGSYNFVNTELANPEITNAKFSSLYVEKADFFKLDNLSIGYTFDIKENDYVKGVRITASAQNLFTITNYTGSDPEPALQDRGSEADNGGFTSTAAFDPLIPGIDRRSNYFAARTFTLGLNVNF